MWTSWNDTASEDDGFSTPMSKQDLVLSWKQLSVSVEKKTPKLFGRSEVVQQQILNNGKENKFNTYLIVLKHNFIEITKYYYTCCEHSKNSFIHLCTYKLVFTVQHI